VVAVLTEIVLSLVLLGRWPQLSSAYITGISVGILVRTLTAWWPFVLCSMISIASKYALRYHNRHLWNPSNFGVSVCFFLAPAGAVSLGQQFGNHLAPVIIIWTLGALILFSLGRLHITVSAAVVYLSWTVIQCARLGTPWQLEVAVYSSPVYQLFLLFMITDPRTTTRTKGRQCAVAVLVAVVDTAFRYFFKEVHAPYYALFIVGPVTNLIEMWWDGRKGAKRPAVAAILPAAAAGSASPAPATPEDRAAQPLPAESARG
jgi:hypothetical protein